MMKKKDLDASLEFLKKDSFMVPDGYFDQLPDQIMQRIGEEETVKVRSHRLPKRWLVWASTAAAVLVMGWFGIRHLYWLPLQEQRIEQEIAWLVEAYPDVMHEGTLVDYVLEAGIETEELFEDPIDMGLEYNPEWMIEINSKSITN